jgi:hypothetical protein
MYAVRHGGAPIICALTKRAVLPDGESYLALLGPLFSWYRVPIAYGVQATPP